MPRPAAVALLLLALAIPACGPTFESESEERAYLHALSNPTPAQWKRRKQLDDRAESADLQKRTLNRAIYEGQAAAEKATTDVEAVEELMRRGAEKEAAGEHGVASRYYRDVAEKYPGSTRAAEARRKQEAAEKIAYPEAAKP